ncbi:hypothetical protein HMN09_01043700 [Mycena chlorophos]|uniref:3-hydroxyisobutyrate dehydrogenase n=1 Tax=Mycena chlorophos TaxID=658473 RepID=A0A8H6W1I6_MYCCL|nr:hypothetical protein HMN09_01043700 [Mycena chlorophos]
MVSHTSVSETPFLSWLSTYSSPWTRQYCAYVLKKATTITLRRNSIPVSYISWWASSLRRWMLSDMVGLRKCVVPAYPTHSPPAPHGPGHEATGLGGVRIRFLAALMLPPRRLGWIGLGAMGWPMAQQLLFKNPAATFYIYDVDRTLLVEFAQSAPDRVKIAANATEVATKADWVFTIVPEGRHVRQVYLAEGTGILAAENLAGKMFIDCSTIDIETSLDVGAAVITAGADFIDAPVSGGTAGAAKGAITFMVGIAADDARLPILATVLSMVGSSMNAMGGKGLGLAAKLSNNYLSGCIAIATAEAMSMGMKLGIDPKILSATFDKGTGANWVNRSMNPVPGVCPEAATSNGYVGGFKVELMEKDMRLATQAARQVGAKLVLGEAAVSAYAQTASDPDFRGKDSRVVYQWLNKA